MPHFLTALWKQLAHPLVVSAFTVVANVWIARLASHREHRKTAEKVDAIHGQLNGGLTERIKSAVREAIEERE